MHDSFGAGSELGLAVRRHRFVLGHVVLLSAVLNILVLGGSFFMLLVYDEVLPSRSIPTLVGLVVIITVVYLFQALLELVRSRVMIQVGALFDQQISGRVFDVITRFELRNGPLREGMQPVRDLDQIRAFMSGTGPLAILDLPWMVLFLGVLFLFHWVLGLVATAGVLVLIGLMVATDRLTKKPTARATAIGSARLALGESSRRNAEVIHALGMADRGQGSWKALGDHYLTAADRLADVSGRMQSAGKTFRMLLQSLMLAAGAALVIDDMASGGIIIAGSILSARALAPVEQAIGNWKGFVAARQAWTRLETVLEQVPPEPRLLSLPAPRATLAVENVSVGPPGANKLTVHDVSFALKAGDALGIIGPSGSGKSTLLRALLGIWTPMEGAVRLDGAALDQWTSSDLGRHIGFMPQAVELFDGSIAQNIARFTPNADPADVLAAAKAADVHELIVRLPKGYEYPIGPNGGSLSAGQRQRVALARALYGDPFLLALDEPNSNLDIEGEAALSRAIGDLRHRGAITLLVAHRPSVLQEVSHVLFMVEGRARLFGARDEVLSKINFLPAPGSAPARAAPPLAHAS